MPQWRVGANIQRWQAGGRNVPVVDGRIPNALYFVGGEIVIRWAPRQNTSVAGNVVPSNPGYWLGDSYVIRWVSRINKFTLPAQRIIFPYLQLAGSPYVIYWQRPLNTKGATGAVGWIAHPIFSRASGSTPNTGAAVFQAHPVMFAATGGSANFTAHPIFILAQPSLTPAAAFQAHPIMTIYAVTGQPEECVVQPAPSPIAGGTVSGLTF